MMQNLWRCVEDGQICGGPQVRPDDFERRTWQTWVPNMVDDQRVPGELDAGWSDELQSDHVVQTLHSRPMDPADLESVRVVLWEQIKRHRDTLSDTGGYAVTVGGVAKWFHSDAKSKTQQLALTMLGASVPAVPWKTMDGSFVTMSQSLAGAIFQAALVMDMALFSHAETLKAAVYAAADPASIDVTAGWPETYGGG